jgi:hypothetical protein
MVRVARYVEVFDRRTGAFVAAIPVSAPLAELQRLFGTDPENPIYDCYPVKAEHVESLEAWTGQLLDLGAFNYYLSAEAG